MRELLSALDGSPTSYLRAARELDGCEAHELDLRPLRLSLLSTFTGDVLVPYLAVEGARKGLAVRTAVAPFGQLEQQLLEPGSAVYRSDPDVIAIAVRVDDAAPALVHDFVRLSPDDVGREVEQLVGRLETLVRAARARSDARILVWNQPLPARLAAGLADASLDPSQTDVFGEVNRRISRLCRGVSDAYVFDACRVAAELGLARWQDPKLLHLARVPLSVEAQVATARSLARHLGALVKPPCKCLVLDLDNTLWGGVLGEEGVGGVAMGEDYPGSAYRAFQRQLRSYRDRGVMLAIASKNNEGDVVELFERHPDLVLRWDDFAARQIHWNDKASSLAAIAVELNVSTDALAFFDDSPVEREWVRQRMPEVQVIEVPRDPLQFGAALDGAGVFDHLVLTEEDRRRADLYRSDRARRELSQGAASVEEFLRALAMRVTIGAVDTTTLPRVAQLLAKTNQFNLTTRRHTPADLARMLAEGALGLWMRIEDRFGDNGLVGAALAIEQPPDAIAIDTFLLSCRVMGRMAERALLAAVARRARARGASRLLGEYLPTRKNRVVAEFYGDCGFTAVPGRTGWWELDLSAGVPGVPALFEVIERT